MNCNFNNKSDLDVICNEEGLCFTGVMFYHVYHLSNVSLR